MPCCTGLIFSGPLTRRAMRTIAVYTAALLLALALVAALVYVQLRHPLIP